jgi:hypothetical protein
MTVSQKIGYVVRRFWVWLLAAVGVPGLWDLLREFLRGKLLDSIASRLGTFGDWLKDNPVSFFTIGLTPSRRPKLRLGTLRDAGCGSWDKGAVEILKTRPIQIDDELRRRCSGSGGQGYLIV